MTVARERRHHEYRQSMVNASGQCMWAGLLEGLYHGPYPNTSAQSGTFALNGGSRDRLSRSGTLRIWLYDLLPHIQPWPSLIYSESSCSIILLSQGDDSSYTKPTCTRLTGRQSQDRPRARNSLDDSIRRLTPDHHIDPPAITNPTPSSLTTETRSLTAPETHTQLPSSSHGAHSTNLQQHPYH